MDPLEQAHAFAEAASLEEKWDAARQMMYSKAKPSEELFYSLLQQGLDDLGDIALSGEDSNRLAATDLLVRLPASMKNNKRVQAMARDVRLRSLAQPLPALSTISGKDSLPGNAKPAEVRENIALALKDASGQWVMPYVLRALADEERSQRCRIALARELAAKESSIDRWLELLLQEPGLQAVSDRDMGTAAGRLRDLCQCLVEAIRAGRSSLTVTPVAGQLLAKLVRITIPLREQQHRPKGLEKAAQAAIELLDEILAVRLTVMDEPDLYDVVYTVFRWWSPRPFPDTVNTALAPIIDKLTAGLVFRARSGQRSDVMLQRLKQATNNSEHYNKSIQGILDNELGFSGEIQDWLRGIERGVVGQHSAVLSAVGTEAFIRQLAEVFRLALDDRVPESQTALQLAVKSLAAQHGLSAVGGVGDIVEYSSNVHSLPAGAPKERSVRIVRPAIMRRRHDGGSDILIKGLVSTV